MWMRQVRIWMRAGSQEMDEAGSRMWMRQRSQDVDEAGSQDVGEAGA
jgi:hypothetical protein